jgi:hypothetical protein
MNESFTNANGSSSLSLVPSTYVVRVYFQGVNVVTATANLTSDQTVTMPTGVYSVPLQVKSAIGLPVQGAGVTVASESANFNLTSDANGMAYFLAVPNKEYNVSVSIAGSTLYTGTILGSPSRATFELGTSYLPTSIQVGIIGAVALAMLVASLFVYLTRRRPKVSESTSRTIMLSPSSNPSRSAPARPRQSGTRARSKKASDS